MTILVTGAAGFIGYYVSMALLDRGEKVVGIDNLNDYYDPALKQARLDQVISHKNYTFLKTDLADNAAIAKLGTNYNLTAIIHLGAQAGVRYSIENPAAYVQSNLVGHANILELARNSKNLAHLVYASSSSVYGGQTETPFNEDMIVDTPVSLYAATKKSDELLSQSYAHLYNIPMTGLRFFTVYGPWGRPDMAPWLFTEAILNGKPIKVFNHGKMLRDFTYIDDITSGVLSALANPPKNDGTKHLRDSKAPHRVLNIGNNKPVPLMEFISEIERACGCEAEKIMMPMQAGDVTQTYADLTKTKAVFDFEPKTQLREGITNFVNWYKVYKDI